MAAELLPEKLWELVKPFIPISRAKAAGMVGRTFCGPGISQGNSSLCLRSGTPWEMLLNWVARWNDFCWRCACAISRRQASGSWSIL